MFHVEHAPGTIRWAVAARMDEHRKTVRDWKREATEWRARAEHLQAAVERLRSLAIAGESAGFLAHELNNLFTPVVGYCHAAQAPGADELIRGKAIAKSLAAAERVGVLAEAILGLAVLIEEVAHDVPGILLVDRDGRTTQQGAMSDRRFDRAGSFKQPDVCEHVGDIASSSLKCWRAKCLWRADGGRTRQIRHGRERCAETICPIPNHSPLSKAAGQPGRTPGVRERLRRDAARQVVHSSAWRQRRPGASIS